MRKFDAPENWDKLTKANAAVLEVQSTVQESIEKLHKNNESMDKVHSSSFSMRTSAFEFNRSSEDLERMMEWRNKKIKLILGGIAAACCFVVILILWIKIE